MVRPNITIKLAKICLIAGILAASASAQTSISSLACYINGYSSPGCTSNVTGNSYSRTFQATAKCYNPCSGQQSLH